mgnify:CR=1 FL=1
MTICAIKSENMPDTSDLLTLVAKGLTLAKPEKRRQRVIDTAGCKIQIGVGVNGADSMTAQEKNAILFSETYRR